MSRNTPVLEIIVNALTDSRHVKNVILPMLEEHFQNDLLIVAGNIQTVEELAKELRINITKEECAQVLDFIAQHAMVGIAIEHVETAAYSLFGNRFIEP